MTDVGNVEATCARSRELDLAAFALDRGAAEWATFRAHYPRCAACAREVARFAQLAVALERESSAASAHPEERELVAFASARAGLAAATSPHIARHLAHCAACRSELGVLQRFDLRALEPSASASSAREPIWRGMRWLRDALRAPLQAPAFAFAAAAIAILVFASWWLRQQAAPPADSARPTLAIAPPASEREAPKAAANEPATIAADRGTEVVAPAAAKIAGTQAAPRSRDEAEHTQTARAAPPSVPAAGLAAPEPAREEPPPLERIASRIPPEPPHYAPGALASGPLVRVVGVGRGEGENAPRPLALGPPQLGLTSRESPNLYWYLPAPTTLSVAVTVVSDADAAPLIDLTLAGPNAAGVHSVSLRERGARLAPGVDYQWFVAVVRDPERRSRDLVASAAIRFTPPSAELAARLADARERLAHVYAETGLWYDAYDQLSRWIANEPDAAILRAHRAALLDQVGLAAAAGNDLSAAPASAPAP